MKGNRVLRVLCPLLVALAPSACVVHIDANVSQDNGRVEAVAIIATYTPTSTATPEAPTPTPTATLTPAPTATPTAIPTATPTPQALTCNHTVAPGTSVYDGQGVQPGQTVCLPAGTRGPLTLANLHGTATQKITVVNSGGVVRFAQAGYTGKLFQVTGSDHLVVRGNGVESACGAEVTVQRCGIIIDGGTSGVFAQTAVSDLAISHIEIRNSGLGQTTFAAGVKIHTRIGSAPVYNTRIERVWIHNTLHECVYLGLAGSDGDSPMIGAWMRHSLLEDCGWDFVDWKQVQGANEIAYNVMRRGGAIDDTTQDKGVGLILSGGTWIHHNWIEDVWGECIKTLNPLNGIVIENNVIRDCGRHHVLDRFAVNTIVRANELWLPGDGIDVRGSGEVSGNVMR